MATQLTGSFITIDQSNINTSKTSVQQLVDIVQSDVSSTDSNTRKSYEVFTSGGVDQHPITSSLFQTVYDQEFNLGTANPLFDVSIGSLLEKSTDESGNTVLTVNGLNPTEDGGGKLIFTNSSKIPMMREKVNIYRQFAQNLLGDADSSFFLPHDATSEEDLLQDNTNFLDRNKKIRGAFFICFRRLFVRDNIRKGTFGLRIFKKANRLYSEFVDIDADKQVGTSITNLTDEITNSLSGNDTQVISDVLSATNMSVSPVAGEVSTLTDPQGKHVGVIFYDSGIIVLDVERVFDPNQYIRGEITSTRLEASGDTFDVNGPFAIFGRKDGQNAGAEKWYYPVYKADDTDNSRIEFQDFVAVKHDNTTETASVWYHADGDNQINNVAGGDNPPASGLYPIWSQMTSAQRDDYYSGTEFEDTDGLTLHDGKLYPSLWTSGTIDSILDHICVTRFGRENRSSISFRNETVINSSLIFCRAAPSQLNYSTNPTFTNDDGEIVVIEKDNPASEPFCFVTTVGLYDASGDLLAVAKTSRPIEKNPETDLSIRIRLDY